MTQGVSKLNSAEQSTSAPEGALAAGAMAGATTGAMAGATTGATVGGRPRRAGQRLGSTATAQSAGIRLARVTFPGAEAGSEKACWSWQRQTGILICVLLKAVQHGFDGAAEVLLFTYSMQGCIALNSALQSTSALAMAQHRSAIATAMTAPAIALLAVMFKRAPAPQCFSSRCSNNVQSCRTRIISQHECGVRSYR